MTEQASNSERRTTVTRIQWRLFAVILGTMTASIALWFLNSDRQAFLGTGIYFILLPGLLAAMMAILPLGQDRTGFDASRSTAIAILCSAFIVREGFICVLMALPIILPIVAIVVWSIRSARSKSAQLLVPLALFGLSAEGVAYQVPPAIEVSATHVVDATPQQLHNSLNKPAELPEVRPLLFKLPFPKPVSVDGNGSEIGDVRRVDFDTGGHLDFRVIERTQNSISWQIEDRSTPMREWLNLSEATASWVENTTGELEVTMTIAFERRLAPAIYFDPLERWGVGEMADVLLDMLAHNVVQEKR